MLPSFRPVGNKVYNLNCVATEGGHQQRHSSTRVLGPLTGPNTSTDVPRAIAAAGPSRTCA
jgi:hypothetical protein